MEDLGEGLDVATHEGVPLPTQFRTFLREAFAVLAAILIAFGLDAAWEAQTERRATLEALRAVLEEFEVVRSQLSEAIEANRVGVAGKDEVLSLNPGDLPRCLLYKSDAADDPLCVVLAGRRTINKTTRQTPPTFNSAPAPNPP